MKDKGAKKIRKTKKKARQPKAKARMERIFSGEKSRRMWGAINRANTVPDLVRALFRVCCRLQEFEARFEKGNRP